MIRIPIGKRSTRSLGLKQRLLILLAILSASIALVYNTGGSHSPMKMLFLVPVLAGSFLFGIYGYLPVIATLCGVQVYFFTVDHLTTRTFPFAALQTAGFFLTALILGVGTDLLLQRLQSAYERAEQIEWLSDTVVMMQSMASLEQALSVALLRLDEWLVFDSAAIFLRDGDDSDLQLVQTMGLPAERVGVSSIPAHLLPIHHAIRGPILWATEDLDGKLPFREIDRSAVSGMVVPLCTPDSLIGFLHFGKRGKSGFSRTEKNRATLFSEHMLFPLQRARLQAMATTDILTGLANRRAFWQHLRNETERIRRYMHPLSLLLIDIDHFKAVNDNYGHLTGDAVLSQLGRVIRSAIRESDFAARYGGEELAVICQESTTIEAVAFAERIRQVVAETSFQTAEGQPIQITVSIGVATIPSHVSEPVGLVSAADEALYQAKHTGRNRVCPANTPTPTGIPVSISR